MAMLPSHSGASPHPLLQDLALWCDRTMASADPRLIGVIPGPTSVSLEIISLDIENPISDLGDLVAPDDWELLVVRCRIGATSCGFAASTITHALDRSGHSATELTPTDLATGPLRGPLGRIDTACRSVFGLDACVL